MPHEPSVRVKVVYLAPASMNTKRREELLDLPAGSCVADFINFLADRYGNAVATPAAGATGQMDIKVALHLDGEWVTDFREPVRNGAQFVVVPPIAGGS